MEIRVYDNSFNFKGIIENQTSLLWHRMYNENGDFTLTVPITQDNMYLLQMGNIIWIKGKVEAGVIESKEVTKGLNYDIMTIKGRFLEAYFDRRLVNVSEYTGLTEIAMRSLIDSVTPIPMLELGEVQGFTDEITFQAIYKSLFDAESKLAKSANLGFRLRPDFINKKIIFEIYKGIDHSINQYDNTKVIFSDEYDNLASVRQFENDQIYYNVVIVGGKDANEQMIYVPVGDINSIGLNRRETYLDATDVDAKEMTEEQFIETLKSRGNSALGGHGRTNSFECSVLPNGNFIYGKDYDLGDIVTVKKTDWGISKNLRLSEVTEVYEHEIPKIEVVLGTTLPTKFTWE